MNRYSALLATSALALAGCSSVPAYKKTLDSIPLQPTHMSSSATALDTNTNLESMLTTGKPLQSGVRFDMRDSFNAAGVNAVRLELYSSAKTLNPWIGAIVEFNEDNYNGIKNKVKTKASLTIVPQAGPHPHDNTNLYDFHRSIDGKSARGAIFGLGVLTTSGSLPVAGIGAVAETGADYVHDRYFTNRRIYVSSLKYVPSQLRQSPQRIIVEGTIDNERYALSIELGKNYKPDDFAAAQVNLQEIGSTHSDQAFELTWKDKRMRENFTAFILGLIGGESYHLLKKTEVPLNPEGAGMPTIHPKK